MRDIIHFGDLHCTEKEPHRSSCLKFLDWLYENYNDCIIISGGDLFDRSSHRHDLVFEVTEKLKQFEDFRVVEGNHDKSLRLTSILTNLKHFPNITVYDLQTEFEINGITFIALPSKYHSEKEYEKIEGVWDYSLNHFTPIQESFSNEGVEIKFKVNVAHVFSHIHRHAEYKDNFGNNLLISGSVVNTRLGEQEWGKYIFKLNKTGYEKIAIPLYHDYVEIDFNSDLPENKDNLYILKNCPTRTLAFEKYKDYYIHSVQLKVNNRTDAEQEDATSFSNMNLSDRLNMFLSLDNINADIKKYSLDKLKNLGL